MTTSTNNYLREISDHDLLARIFYLETESQRLKSQHGASHPHTLEAMEALRAAICEKAERLRRAETLAFQRHEERKGWGSESPGAIEALIKLNEIRAERGAVNRRAIEIDNLLDSRRKRVLKRFAESLGLKGASGGWLYRISDGKPVCQGYESLVHRFPQRLQQFLQDNNLALE